MILVVNIRKNVIETFIIKGKRLFSESLRNITFFKEKNSKSHFSRNNIF